MPVAPCQVDKLVKVFRYPEVLHNFTFSWDYMMKGLILDKARAASHSAGRPLQRSASS